MTVGQPNSVGCSLQLHSFSLSPKTLVSLAVALVYLRFERLQLSDSATDLSAFSWKSQTCICINLWWALNSLASHVAAAKKAFCEVIALLGGVARPGGKFHLQANVYYACYYKRMYIYVHVDTVYRIAGNFGRSKFS